MIVHLFRPLSRRLSYRHTYLNELQGQYSEITQLKSLLCYLIPTYTFTLLLNEEPCTVRCAFVFFIRYTFCPWGMITQNHNDLDLIGGRLKRGMWDLSSTYKCVLCAKKLHTKSFEIATDQANNTQVWSCFLKSSRLQRVSC